MDYIAVAGIDLQIGDILIGVAPNKKQADEGQWRSWHPDYVSPVNGAKGQTGSAYVIVNVKKTDTYTLDLEYLAVDPVTLRGTSKVDVEQLKKLAAPGHLYKDLALVFLVHRLGHQKSPSRAKVIPDWPHSCPRCGAPAAVGLFEVVHKDEVKAASCPARRK